MSQSPSLSSPGSTAAHGRAGTALILAGAWCIHRTLVDDGNGLPTGPDVTGEDEEAMNDVATKWVASLASAGIRVRRSTGKDLYEWLLKWFNPKVVLAVHLDCTTALFRRAQHGPTVCSTIYRDSLSQLSWS